MRTSILILLLSLAILVTSCNHNSKDVASISEKINKDAKIPSNLRDISIITLIANPGKYVGDTVIVSGFLNLEFEGNALYIHKEDYEHRLYKNSIWIDIDRDSLKTSIFNKYNKKYVEIEGVFSESTGHMGGFSGSVNNISRIWVLPTGNVLPPTKKIDHVEFPPPHK